MAPGNDEPLWREQLGPTDPRVHNSRYVSVQRYKNEIRVDIRGYFYDHNNDKGLQPTKAGISLTAHEFRSLARLIPQIQEELRMREV